MKRVRAGAAAVVAAVSACPAPGAAATPSVDTEAVVISQATVDGYDFITRRITIQPGGSTGWHYHDGQVFAVVHEGTLTRTLADCTEVVDPTGAPIVEDSGPNHVHVGRNLGTVPVVLFVNYIQPAGAPLSVDTAPPPTCRI